MPDAAGSPPERTYEVSDLCADIAAVLEGNFPPRIWVQGEISGIRAPGRSGHVYFTLLEKDEDRHGVKARMGAALFRNSRVRVERKLAAAGHPFKLEDGIVVRLLAKLDFYPPHGKLQLIADDIDLAFTIGRMALDRAAILARLKADGLLDRQRQLVAPELPLRVGLVTGKATAALSDFVGVLRSSGLGFQVLLCTATMEGQATEREVSRALATLATHDPDVICVVRGGGARDALAWFDAEGLCRAIASQNIPVLVGVGHSVDQSLADQVAHASFATPTAVAEGLVRRVGAWRDHRDAVWDEILDGAWTLIQQRRDWLSQVGRELEGHARSRVRGEDLRLRAAASALPDLVPRSLRDRRRALLRVADLVSAGARERLSARRQVLVGWEAELGPGVVRRMARLKADVERLEGSLSAQSRRLLARWREVVDLRRESISLVSPERTLARGFSITYGPGGRAIRAADEVAEGSQLRTQLARGTVSSVVLGGSGDGEGSGAVQGAQVRGGDDSSGRDSESDP